MGRAGPGEPARAQDQAFATFQAELWPDAKAKGITRATFDLAMRGDEIVWSADAGYRRATNRAGGVEGGMSTGEQIVVQ